MPRPWPRGLTRHAGSLALRALFLAGRLAGGAFLLRLRRAAITPAISVATPARAVLRDHREGCAAHQ